MGSVSSVFGTLFFSLLFFSLRAYTDSKEGKRSWDGRVVGKWIMVDSSSGIRIDICCNGMLRF